MQLHNIPTESILDMDTKILNGTLKNYVDFTVLLLACVLMIAVDQQFIECVYLLLLWFTCNCSQRMRI